MSSTRSPAGTTIKIRAGGSGQSAVATKPAPAAAASASAQPAKIVLKPAAAAAAAAPAAASSSSSAAVSKPLVTLAARSSDAVSSQAAVPSASKAAPSKPTYSASTSSSSSSAGSAAKVSVAPVVPAHGKNASASSTYENPSSYTFPASDSAAHMTPNGINLSLSSADAQAPNLLPPRTRSDRLRAAALAENREEVVALLGMPGGVDVNAADPYGMTAAMLAASRGSHAILEELLELGGANVHLKDKYGQTALIFAAAAASYECVQMLLDRKAGVNVLTSKGQSALMKVAYISHPHSALIADLLCRHKARPDLLSADGASAASIAVQHDHLEILQVLAHYGANVNLKIGTPSVAAAAAAAGTGSVSASAAAAGASSSSASTAPAAASAKTLLHLAASRGSYTMISHLVALGADPLAVDGEGKSMLEVPPPASAASVASASGSAVASGPKEFRARLQSAIDRGLAMREEHARVLAENAAIIARLKAERLARLREEKIQAELQAAADAAQAAKSAGSSSSAASSSASARPSALSASSSASAPTALLSPSRLAIESRVDAELGLAGRRVLYTDAEGVEHYSAPPSPTASLSAEQLKQRTYKPKLDPTSVFGDSSSSSSSSSGFSAGLQREAQKADAAAEQEQEQEELGNGVGYDDDEPTFSYHELLQARLHGTSSGSARTAPVAAPMRDDDEEEEEAEEMKMVAGNSY